jgi:Phage portal protein
MELLRRIHTALRAALVKWFRTRAVLRVIETAHAEELRITPINQWPITQARQSMEVEAIRAGKLDIVDRKSWAWPFMPSSVTRLATPIIKATPYALRRMSRTPVPRRALNMIKNSVISLPWEVRPIEGEKPVDDEQDTRQDIARKTFSHPNNQDSFQTLIEQAIEDICCFGAMAIEVRQTLAYNRPLKCWPVNVESIRIFPSWTESTPDAPRYAQMTGLKGERGAIVFYDDDMLYIRDNPSTDTPFGLGKMEVAFQSITYLLGLQDMAGRAGVDATHKSWLWWEQPQTDAAYQIVRRHIQNELEGQAKISIIGGMKKPDVLEIQPTTIDDLLIPWQEMLIRMLANAFDMSAMGLGIEHDINKAVGAVLDDKDFRSAVVPMAKRIQEAFTRKLLHEILGWYDLEFVFLNLDDPDFQTKMEMCGRMYSTNGITPNEIRKKMGMQELGTPFADLTQAEMMLLNIEAQVQVQERLQTFGLKLQQKAQDAQDQRYQQQMQDQGGPQDQDQPSSGAASPMASVKPPNAGSFARGGQPPSPQAMSLPKYPIASSYDAKKIASMPVNQIQDLMYAGELPPVAQLLSQMEEQEPGILETLTDEVKQFFEQALEDDDEKQRKPLTNQFIKKWQQEQKVRFSKAEKRTNDFADYLRTQGPNAGRPGGANLGKIGKPGNANPVRKG